LNVFEVNSQGASGASVAASVPAAPSPVSLGSFETGVITVDPTTGAVYVGAQSGFARPQLFVSQDNGSTFTAGPMLPTLSGPLTGIAANGGSLAVLYNNLGGSENAIILPSGESTIGSPVTMFTESNGSLLLNERR
jgi:hypothetical protein